MNIADITVDNAIDFVKYCSRRLIDDVEEFKEKVFIDERGRVGYETNACIIEDLCDIKNFNYYFPLDYESTTSYIFEFKDILDELGSPIIELSLYMVATRIYSLINDKMFFFFSRPSNSDPIENRDEIIKIIKDYRDGEFNTRRRKLLFEHKLSPVSLSQELIHSNIELEMIDLTIINLEN